MQRADRRRPWRQAIALVVVAAGLAACGGDDESDSATATEVVIELVAFAPEQLEVEAGTTVTWQQRDIGDHTVTSGTVEQGSSGVTQVPDDEFDSGLLSTDATFRHTFEEPGTYPYFCELHPATMRGEIRVT